METPLTSIFIVQCSGLPEIVLPAPLDHFRPNNSPRQVPRHKRGTLGTEFGMGQHAVRARAAIHGGEGHETMGT